MGADQLVFLIPISAIVLGIGSDIVRRILKSQERRLEMRLRAQQGQNADVTRQIEALRSEIAGLRDTSTQFDLSLENALQRLEERVDRMESKRQSPVIPMGATEETQRVGRY